MPLILYEKGTQDPNCSQDCLSLRFAKSFSKTFGRTIVYFPASSSAPPHLAPEKTTDLALRILAAIGLVFAALILPIGLGLLGLYQHGKIRLLQDPEQKEGMQVVEIINQIAQKSECQPLSRDEGERGRSIGAPSSQQEQAAMDSQALLIEKYSKALQHLRGMLKSLQQSIQSIRKQPSSRFWDEVISRVNQIEALEATFPASLDPKTFKEKLADAGKRIEEIKSDCSKNEFAVASQKLNMLLGELGTIFRTLLKIRSIRRSEPKETGIQNRKPPLTVITESETSAPLQPAEDLESTLKRLRSLKSRRKWSKS